MRRNKHTTKSSTSTRTKGARVRPTNRAYSDADPGLVYPAAAAAAAIVAVAVAAATPATAADDFGFLK